MQQETQTTETANPTAKPVDKAPAEGKKKKVSSPKKTVAKKPPNLDDVLALLATQETELKAAKEQIQRMLNANGELKKTVKIVVKEASKNDELVAELSKYRRKWSNLQGLLTN